MKKPSQPACPCLGSTVVGARGQIVIPKNIRDSLGLKKGSTLIALQMENGPVVLLPAHRARDLFSSINRNLRKLTR